MLFPRTINTPRNAHNAKHELMACCADMIVQYDVVSRFPV